MIYQFTTTLRSPNTIPAVLNKIREVFISLSTSMCSQPSRIFFPVEDLSRHVLLFVTFDGSTHTIRFTANDEMKIATLELQDLPEGWLKITSWDCFI